MNHIHTIRSAARRLLKSAALGVLVVLTSFSLIAPPTVSDAHAETLLDSLARLSQTGSTAQTFPQAADREAPRVMRISVTAYNSEVGQTDSTPFHTADMTHVRDGIVAANFLPLGTRVKFPEIYGDKEFVVKDRMNPRYTYRADIWMEHRSDAITFGHKFTTIEIY